MAHTRIIEETMSKTGQDRLMLIWTQTDTDREVSSDFHSLIWQTRSDNGWENMYVINRDMCGGGWIEEIGSFDADARIAVVKFAAPVESMFGPPGAMVIERTWKEWSFLTGKAVRIVGRNAVGGNSKVPLVPTLKNP